MSLVSRVPRLPSPEEDIAVTMYGVEGAEPQIWRGSPAAFLSRFGIHEPSTCAALVCEGRACAARREPFDDGRASRWESAVEGKAQAFELLFARLDAEGASRIESALSGIANAQYTTHDYIGDEERVYLGVTLILSRTVDAADLRGVAESALRYLGLSDLGVPSVGLCEFPSHPSDVGFACEVYEGRLLDVDLLGAARADAGADGPEDDNGAGGVQDVDSLLRKSSRGEVLKLDFNIIVLLDALLPKVFRWNGFSKSIEIVVHDKLTATQRELAQRVAKSSEGNVPMILKLELFAETDVQFDGEAIAASIRFVAERDGYNPLTDYLERVVWDGVSRVDSVLIDCFGAEDTDHYRRISRRWLIGAVARALNPGCKVDNVVIFEGPEGLRKTSGIEALAGQFYSSTEITLGDKDSKLAASSSWFIELAELHSFRKTGREAVNAFITTKEDFYRAPYGRSMVRTPRSCIFIGTTNDEQYLPNEPGNRRWWPVFCTKIDIPLLLRLRDQIWAEAVAIYKASETCEDCGASTDTVFGQRARCAVHRWWLDPEEETVAKQLVRDREETGTVYDMVYAWWYGMNPERRPREFTLATAMKEALKMEDADAAKAGGTEASVGKALASLGFSRRRAKNEDGTRPRFYVASEALMEAPVKASGRPIGKLVALAPLPKT